MDSFNIMVHSGVENIGGMALHFALSLATANDVRSLVRLRENCRKYKKNARKDIIKLMIGTIVVIECAMQPILFLAK